MHRPGRSLLRARQAGSAGTPKPPRRQCRGGGGFAGWEGTKAHGSQGDAPPATHGLGQGGVDWAPGLGEQGAAGAGHGDGLAGSGRGWRGSGLGGQRGGAPLSSARRLPGGRNGESPPAPERRAAVSSVQVTVNQQLLFWGPSF